MESALSMLRETMRRETDRSSMRGEDERGARKLLALERVARFERNHGPTPESAMLRARTLRAMGNAPAAGRAFDEIVPLAAASGRKAASRTWTWRLRTMIARRFG